MITFKDLIQQVKFNDVKEALFELEQEDSIEGYEKVFNELLLMQPITKENEDWILDVRWVKGVFEDDDPFVDVSGLWLNSSDPEQHWALEFTPWAEWLSMKTNKEQIKEFGKATYIAHCLWEMTFDGFDQETIKKHIEEIERRYEKVKEVDDLGFTTKDVLKKINDSLEMGIDI